MQSCVFILCVIHAVMAQDFGSGSGSNLGSSGSAQPISFQPMSFSPLGFAGPSAAQGASAPVTSETNESTGSSSSALEDCGSSRCPAPVAPQKPRATNSQRGSGQVAPLAGTNPTGSFGTNPTGNFGDQIRQTIQNQLNMQFGHALGQTQTGRSDQ